MQSANLSIVSREMELAQYLAVLRGAEGCGNVFEGVLPCLPNKLQLPQNLLLFLLKLDFIDKSERIPLCEFLHATPSEITEWR